MVGIAHADVQGKGQSLDMDITRLRIAVVGAGIGGVAAALALRLRGAEVNVHERAEGLGEVGAGIQVGPNGVKVLDALGVGRAMREIGQRPDALQLANTQDRALMRMPLGAVAEARWGAPYLHIHRADLLSCLTNAAERAGVSFALGSTVTASMDLDADLVIGADGIRSALLRELSDADKVSFTGQVAYRGLVPTVDLEGWDMPQETMLLMGPRRHAVLYRLRQGSLLNVVAVEERADWKEVGWSQLADMAELRSAFAGFPDVLTKALAAMDQGFVWGLFGHAPLDRWHTDRLALLGDAAHPMLPFLAQGAAMALEDAWCLAHELGAYRTMPAALAHYQRKRRPRTSRVQRKAAGQARLYHAQPPLAQVLHTGMRTIQTLAPGFAARKYDWLYGFDVTA